MAVTDHHTAGVGNGSRPNLTQDTLLQNGVGALHVHSEDTWYESPSKSLLIHHSWLSSQFNSRVHTLDAWDNEVMDATTGWTCVLCVDLPINYVSVAVKVKVKVKLSLCLTKHHAMKAYWGSGSITPSILDFGTRWRWVDSFTPRLLYPQGKNLRYPFDRRLGGPQSRRGRGGEEKNSHPPSGIEP
jgi:hypothetical protein